MATQEQENIISSPSHLPGLTKICFSQDGSTIFTGGVDCLVRIHKADDPDAEPGFHDQHQDEITSLSCSSTHLFTASKDNIARIFTYPENEFDGFLTRSAGVPVRWVSVDRAGERVAVCSDDLLVKVVHATDTTKISFLSDNAKSVRSASWDPSGKYLVTACCDGKLKIYDMSGTTALNLKIMEGVIGASDSESTTSCYVAWHPSGKYFAAPLRTNDIGMINQDGWSKGSTFSQDGHSSPISELAFSPNGKYLASTSKDILLIWNTENRQVVSRHTAPSPISGLSWSPKSNLLAYTCLDGSFTRWREPIPLSLPGPYQNDVQEKKRVERLLDDDFDMDDDMEDKGEDLDKDDMLDIVGGTEDEVEGEGDWIVDDEGDYGREQKWGKGRTEVVNVTKAQSSFTPGSTSMKGKKRYLAFNMIGAVEVSDQETHHVVNVEFHDKSIRRGYHFQDHSRYSMASMGEQGISFASSSTAELPSEIHYRPYDSWASSSEWTQTLPVDEEATCIASGGLENGLGSVIVSTTRGLIRFFTASGVQVYLWRLGEDVISMSAGKEAVMVVHREGGTSLDGCQNLRYTVMDLENFDITQEGRIPLPKKATLTWLGWSTEGAPIIFDSTGILSVLDKYRRPGQSRWVPILDTNSLKKEGRIERYWPAGVTASHMSCVILKGNEKEPWFPRPLLQEVELRIPLLNVDNQVGKLEESVIRNHLFLSLLTSSISSEAEYDIRQKKITIDKDLLQLVQSACKSDNLSRAYDISRLMLAPTTVEAAAKIAGFYHLAGLEERILGLKGLSRTKERREEKMNKEREKERDRRWANDLSAGAGTNGRATGGERGGMGLEFKSRDIGKTKRFLGGVNNGKREETPQMTPSLAKERNKALIPETPGDESMISNGVNDSNMMEDDEDSYDKRETSPFEKRKRDTEDFEPRKRFDENFNPAAEKKNPFAKKQVNQQSNPFAKPAMAVAKPLDSVKSTSFFDRVDDIESSAANRGAKVKSSKAVKVQPNGKQTTLLGMKKIPAPKTQDTMSTDTGDETQIEETQLGILEESNVQETLSPEAETFEESL